MPTTPLPYSSISWLILFGILITVAYADNFFYTRPVRSESFTNNPFNTNSPYNIQLKLFRNGNAFLEVVRYPILPIEHPITINCDDTSPQTINNWTNYQHNSIHVFRHFIGSFPRRQQLACRISINNFSLSLTSRRIQKPYRYPEVPAFTGPFSISLLPVLDPKDGQVEWSNDPLVEDLACYSQLKIAQDMKQLPIGLLSQIEKAKGNIRVYISLTTTPSRLLKLHYQLASLDLRFVTKIFITIPSLFKGNQKYKIPKKLIQRFPKIQFLFASFDLGPSLKIIGALDYLKSIPNSSRDIVIVMDDDSVYAPSMINSLVYFSLMVPEGVINTSPFMDSLQLFGLPPVKRRYLPNLLAVNRVEGFAGYAFRAGNFDTDIIKGIVRRDLNRELTPCFQSDDIVISYIFLYLGVPIYTTDTSHTMFYTHAKRKPLPYYEDADALHNMRLDGSKSTDDINGAKYNLTVELMGLFFVNFQSLQFETKEGIIKKLEGYHLHFEL